MGLNGWERDELNRLHRRVEKLERILASGMEAGTVETEGLDPKDDSPVGEAETPEPSSIAPVQDDERCPKCGGTHPTGAGLGDCNGPPSPSGPPPHTMIA